MVFIVLGSEVSTEPFPGSWGAIPLQPVKIIAHRMEGSLSRAQIDGLVQNVFADLLDARSLQQLLQCSYVSIIDWSDDALGTNCELRARDAPL